MAETEQKILLTVITPAYNSERTICDTLDSVMALGSDRVEHIVIDDGSSDRTAQIIEQHPSKPILIKQENRGMCPSRNRVIPMAKGDWILFLDADDMTAPNILNLLEQAIETHPEADIHYGDFLACDDDGSNVRPYGSLEDISANPLKALLERNRLGILAALCRTSKIREVNGFDEGMPRSADWDLWIRLAAAGGKFHYLGETIATYRLTEGSASKQFMGMWRALRLIQSNHRALIESTGDRKKIERDHIELLFARDLRYVYGEDEGASWISRRINRTTKVLQLCKKDPNLIPHFMRRTFRKLLHSK